MTIVSSDFMSILRLGIMTFFLYWQITSFYCLPAFLKSKHTKFLAQFVQIISFTNSKQTQALYQYIIQSETDLRCETSHKSISTNFYAILKIEMRESHYQYHTTKIIPANVKDAHLKQRFESWFFWNLNLPEDSCVVWSE